ncbi:adaptor protein MecA [Carnobacterium viridans]|uniref:Adapter protein MecA n=1 Tax=Carnobacterium viridans TaxID=174587 RepID=A0A1H1BGJ8_9LACT|nr:adaptor protein MecA [Carnobacterium viridans]UDE95796.1 adaptor protein MecA [Carnobacterium viridans]SDQ50993.1 adapter protein MecA 1/2 [Carnobacterium viridans]
MEMEHINENTIRVLIENADLEERGVTFLDLLGNHKQIENFFYSILEEVDVDEQFHESDAITFQVLPNGNGLELFISKGGPLNDQLDFSSASENLNSDEFSQYIKKQMVQNLEKSETEIDETVNHIEDEIKEVVLRFNQFEDMIELSKMMHVDKARSNLFLYKECYYLNLVFFVNEMTERSADEEIALALEFAEKTTVTQGVLEEHGKILMEKNALELTRYYFK